MDIVPALIAAGAILQAYDPEGMEEAAKLLNGVQFKDSAYDALNGADFALVLTEWNEFRGLNLSRIKAALKEAAVLDLRNIYNPADMAAAGFRYASIGR